MGAKQMVEALGFAQPLGYPFGIDNLQSGQMITSIALQIVGKLMYAAIWQTT
jgi:hypothetical protein